MLFQHKTEDLETNGPEEEVNNVEEEEEAEAKVDQANLALLALPLNNRGVAGVQCQDTWSRNVRN